MTDQNQINIQSTNLDNIEQAWKKDLWDRKRLGEQLTRYVDRLNCGAVLALDARWGEGKTWFVRHWKKHLEDENHNVIYLDAFANDYLEDPFLVITSEITNILNKDKKTKRKVKKLIELSASVGTALLPSLPKIALTLGLHLVGAGFLSGALQQEYENAKDEIDALSEEASERIKESIQEKIAGHEAEKKTLYEFKKHLSETVEKLEKPLVFIIDELDRCRPDFAIRLIERIKHFFDIPKIVFVLVMDKKQFSKVICHNYGYDEKLGEEYLDKFVDFSISLPLINKINPEELITIPVVKNLFNKVGETSDDIIFIFYVSLKKYMTPREIQKRINIYALLKTGYVQKDMFLILGLQSGTLNILKQFNNIIKDCENDSLKNHSSISTYLKNSLDLEPVEFLNLSEKLQKIERTTYVFSGENYKDELRQKLYSEYAFKPINDLKDFTKQFEDYLNSHLWEDLEIQENCK